MIDLLCEQCKKYVEQYGGEGPFPSHEGSERCESGSIASGGTRAHCSCDVCF